MRLVDPHLKLAKENAFLRARKLAKESAKNGRPAKHYRVQLTEAGLFGVTGHDARKPVEQAIKFEPEPAPIRFHSTEGRIVRD